MSRSPTVGLPYFFFGTLLDADVLSIVLGRPIEPSEYHTAVLRDHQRLAVADVVYPVLRAAPGQDVPGALFSCRSLEEQRRIDHFESGEYETSKVWVRRRTCLVEALVHTDFDGVFQLLHAPWSLADWQIAHKRRYLQLCHGWMSDYAAVGGCRRDDGR
ncbi:MAG: gamma-glutamylcyclotransferase family protein [Pseudomonadota bacterium]